MNTKKYIEAKIDVLDVSCGFDIIKTSGELEMEALFEGVPAGKGNYSDFLKTF